MPRFTSGGGGSGGDSERTDDSSETEQAQQQKKEKQENGGSRPPPRNAVRDPAATRSGTVASESPDPDAAVDEPSTPSDPVTRDRGAPTPTSGGGGGVPADAIRGPAADQSGTVASDSPDPDAAVDEPTSASDPVTREAGDPQRTSGGSSEETASDTRTTTDSSPTIQTGADGELSDAQQQDIDAALQQADVETVERAQQGVERRGGPVGQQASELEQEVLSENPQLDADDVRVSSDGDTITTELTAEGRETLGVNPSTRDVATEVAAGEPGVTPSDVRVERTDEGFRATFTRPRVDRTQPGPEPEPDRGDPGGAAAPFTPADRGLLRAQREQRQEEVIGGRGPLESAAEEFASGLDRAAEELGEGVGVAFDAVTGGSTVDVTGTVPRSGRGEGLTVRFDEEPQTAAGRAAEGPATGVARLFSSAPIQAGLVADEAVESAAFIGRGSLEQIGETLTGQTDDEAEVVRNTQLVGTATRQAGRQIAQRFVELNKEAGEERNPQGLFEVNRQRLEEPVAGEQPLVRVNEGQSRRFGQFFGETLGSTVAASGAVGAAGAVGASRVARGIDLAFDPGQAAVRGVRRLRPSSPDSPARAVNGRAFLSDERGLGDFSQRQRTTTAAEEEQIEVEPGSREEAEMLRERQEFIERGTVQAEPGDIQTERTTDTEVGFTRAEERTILDRESDDLEDRLPPRSEFESEEEFQRELRRLREREAEQETETQQVTETERETQQRQPGQASVSIGIPVGLAAAEATSAQSVDASTVEEVASTETTADTQPRTVTETVTDTAVETQQEQELQQEVGRQLELEQEQELATQQELTTQTAQREREREAESRLPAINTQIERAAFEEEEDEPEEGPPFLPEEFRGVRDVEARLDRSEVQFVEPSEPFGGGTQ